MIGESARSKGANHQRKKVKPGGPAANLASAPARVAPLSPAHPRAGGHHFYASSDAGKQCTGSDHHGFGTKLISDVVGTVSFTTIEGHPNSKDIGVGAAIEALKAFQPADPIEGMIAAQAVALHWASLECLRRAMLGQTPEVASKLRKDGANLARAMTDMLAALDRKRGKGQQHIRVERVTVNEGGQAIVGNVASSSSAVLPPKCPGEVAMVDATLVDKEGVSG